MPAELVIDHSVQVDVFGTRDAFQRNAEREFERNQERYAFLRWGQGAFDDFAVVPPDTGIVHQVNLEYLARVVFADDEDAAQAYPDTLVGTDSHTTMVNGLGVLGWGVGGIEAEAAMLGQPMSMLIPQVLGFELHGRAARGRDRDRPRADRHRDAARARRRGQVRRVLRRRRWRSLPIADRATIGNMSPEFGSTCAIFPIDAETLRYLEFSGRPTEQIELVEAYAKEQGLWHDEDSEQPTFSDTLELDLGERRAEPRRSQAPAGPRRAERTPASASARRCATTCPSDRRAEPTRTTRADRGVLPRRSDPPANGAPGHEPTTPRARASAVATPARRPRRCRRHRARARVRSRCATASDFALDHGHVVIAAITSCTNTSNPSVMLGAGLLARNAVARGPARQAVGEDLAGARLEGRHRVPRPRRPDRAARAARLQPRRLRLHHLHRQLRTAAGGDLGGRQRADLAVVSVLSGNRNFEGRINPDVKMNYLASPPLCVAYALAGTMDIDIVNDPLGQDERRQRRLPARHLADRARDRRDDRVEAVQSDMFRNSYGEVFDGDERWNSPAGARRGERFAWDARLDLRAPAAVLRGHARASPRRCSDIAGARVLALLGDSVTTDHISPAGSIKRDSPAGQLPAGARRRSRATSTPTARAAATTR